MKLVALWTWSVVLSGARLIIASVDKQETTWLPAWGVPLGVDNNAVKGTAVVSDRNCTVGQDPTPPPDRGGVLVLSEVSTDCLNSSLGQNNGSNWLLNLTRFYAAVIVSSGDDERMWSNITQPIDTPFCPLVAIAPDAIDLLVQSGGRVVLDGHPANWMPCGELSVLGWANALMLVPWIAQFAWVKRNLSRHRYTAGPLRQAFVLGPALAILVCAGRALTWFDCPWSAPWSPYVVMSYVAPAMMFQTLWIALLLCLAKGLLCTREGFTRKELLGLAGILAVVYVVASAEHVAGSSWVVTGLQVAMYWVLLVVTVRWANKLLQGVQVYHMYVQEHSMEDYQASIREKLDSLRWLRAFLLVYFGTEVVLATADLINTTAGSSLAVGIGLVLLSLIVDFMSFAILVWQYRAQATVPTFELMQPAGQTAQITPMFRCSMCSPTELESQTVVVIENPGRPNKGFGELAVGLLR